jgi:hypothetical protein
MQAACALRNSCAGDGSRSSRRSRTRSSRRTPALETRTSSTRPAYIHAVALAKHTRVSGSDRIHVAVKSFTHFIPECRPKFDIVRDSKGMTSVGHRSCGDRCLMQSTTVHCQRYQLTVARTQPGSALESSVRPPSLVCVLLSVSKQCPSHATSRGTSLLIPRTKFHSTVSPWGTHSTNSRSSPPDTVGPTPTVFW